MPLLENNIGGIKNASSHLKLVTCGIWYRVFTLPIYMFFIRIIVSFLIIFGGCTSGFATEVRIAYVEISDPRDPVFYYQSVLKLALEKTKITYGDYRISFLDKRVTADRGHHLVASGQFANLIWASVTPARKESMQVIPVNLLRDFNNHRLLLVLSSNKDKFKDITTIAELNNFKAGNGLNWTDTKILNANGIPVTTSVDYALLIKMLKAGRFDYISRGVHEIDSDLKMFDRGDLAIAEGIVLKYQQPIMYSYFVTKTETLLAERLNAGLKLIEEDGSFQQAYENIAAYKAGIDELNKVRHIIELDNSLVLQAIH